MTSAVRDGRELAAALVLAIEARLITTTDAIRIVDEEIDARSSAEAWLIEVSLAPTPQDVLHAARDRAAGHPMLADVWSVLEAMGLALARGAGPLELAAGGVAERSQSRDSVNRTRRTLGVVFVVVAHGGSRRVGQTSRRLAREHP